MTGCAERGRLEGVGEGPQQCMTIYTDLSYIHTFLADLVSPLQFIDRGHIGDGLDQRLKCLSAPHYRLKFGPCVFVMVCDFLRPQFYK